MLISRGSGVWRKRSPMLWTLMQQPHARGTLPARRAPHDRSWRLCAMESPEKVLGVRSGAPLSEVRAAYIAGMRRLHPDVNPDQDTTAAATALNAAYLKLRGSSQTLSTEEAPFKDVFDITEIEPSVPFVNPFACRNVPFENWAALQQIATDSPEAPDEALRRAGVLASDSAVVYLTPAQVQALEEELAASGDLFDPASLESTFYYVTDCLARAQWSNNRWQ
ncbi:hypothetical protein ACKKBG_A03005 [Auxenochlorella protothecoides x Auxenochlorella symbiontica]